jgi:hypothetical protein
MYRPSQSLPSIFPDLYVMSESSSQGHRRYLFLHLCLHIHSDVINMRQSSKNCIEAIVQNRAPNKLDIDNNAARIPSNKIKRVIPH